MIDVVGLELTDVTTWLTLHLLASLRIGAFLVVAPLFGARWVPLPIRVIMAMCLAFPVAAMVPLPQADTIASLAGVRMVLGELLLGVSAGLLLTILFGAAAVAGDRIASTAGLGFAAQVDPSTGGQTPVISQFFGLFLLAIFVAMDGHLAALRLIYDSYRLIPPGSALDFDAIIGAGVGSAQDMFEISVRLMMPVVSALLLINVLIGVLTRSAPQLNIFSFGFPLTMSATMVLLYVTVPGAGHAVTDLAERALSLMGTMLSGAIDG